MSAATYVRRLLLALAAVGGAVILWHISEVLILVFAGIVLATVLDALRRPIVRSTPISGRWALIIVVVSLTTLVVFIGWLTGDLLAGQMDELMKILPNGWTRFTEWLDRFPLLANSLREAKPMPDAGGALKGIAVFATTTLGTLANAALILFLGLFLAAEPDLYRRGTVRLFSQTVRKRVDAALAAAGGALRSWLTGQGISMLFVAITTWIGLSLLGIPSALPLGVLAGLLDFVPFIGPIFAAVPGVLVAFTQGPQEALYVTLLYLAIQQAEAHIVVPLAQRWAVSLPPALAIISVVAFGLMFGFVGVLFATPLMVVVMVLVQKLYIEDVLERDAG